MPLTSNTPGTSTSAGTFARLSIAADRAGACIRLLRFVGLDMTGWALAAQVRLAPDTPGAPLVALAQAAAGSEGLSLAATYIDAASGLPVSEVTLRLSAATMADATKLPYAGELGDASTLAYAIVGTPTGGDQRTLVQGAFIALPTTYGSDAAPTNRPVDPSATGATGGAWELATLAFSNGAVAITIDGATALAPLIAQAQAAATAAAAAAAQAQAGSSSLQAKLASISPRAGWLAVYTDALAGILGGWKLDGSFWTALSGNVDGAIAALKASVASLAARLPLTISVRSGWLFCFTDASGNVLFGATTSGDFYVQGYNLTGFMRAGGVSPALQAALYPSSDLAIWSDSLIENWASMQATFDAAFAAVGAPKRNIFAWGLGGQASLSILARQGGQLARVTFPTGASGLPEIPAGTAATMIAITNDPLVHPGSANAEAISTPATIGIGAGVPGTLTRTAADANGAYHYTFTRAAAGAIIKVPASTPVRLTAAAPYLNRTLIAWPTTNDLIPGATDAPTLFSYFQQYLAAQTTLVKRAIIVMPTYNMTASRRAIYDQLLALLEAAYGDAVIDTIGILQAYGDGSANDNADIAAGGIPRSLRTNSSGVVDPIHPPDGGKAYQVLAAEVVNRLLLKGW